MRVLSCTHMFTLPQSGLFYQILLHIHTVTTVHETVTFSADDRVEYPHISMLPSANVCSEN